MGTDRHLHLNHLRGADPRGLNEGLLLGARRAATNSKLEVSKGRPVGLGLLANLAVGRAR